MADRLAHAAPGHRHLAEAGVDHHGQVRRPPDDHVPGAAPEFGGLVEAGSVVVVGAYAECEGPAHEFARGRQGGDSARFCDHGVPFLLVGWLGAVERERAVREEAVDVEVGVVRSGRSGGERAARFGQARVVHGVVDEAVCGRQPLPALA